MDKQARVWPLQEAKAKFSELVRRAQTEGPQTVTVHGQPAVVITAAERPKIDFNGKTGADFLRAMTAGPPLEFDIPPRPSGGQFHDFSFEE